MNKPREEEKEIEKQFLTENMDYKGKSIESVIDVAKRIGESGLSDFYRKPALEAREIGKSKCLQCDYYVSKQTKDGFVGECNAQDKRLCPTWDKIQEKISQYYDRVEFVEEIRDTIIENNFKELL